MSRLQFFFLFFLQKTHVSYRFISRIVISKTKLAPFYVLSSLNYRPDIENGRSNRKARNSKPVGSGHFYASPSCNCSFSIIDNVAPRANSSKKPNLNQDLRFSSTRSSKWARSSKRFEKCPCPVFDGTRRRRDSVGRGL